MNVGENENIMVMRHVLPFIKSLTLSYEQHPQYKIHTHFFQVKWQLGDVRKNINCYTNIFCEIITEKIGKLRNAIHSFLEIWPFNSLVIGRITFCQIEIGILMFAVLFCFLGEYYILEVFSLS